MDDLQWSDLRQPKKAWFIAAAFAVAAVIFQRSVLDAPLWLLWVWIAVLLATGFFFDWIKTSRARKLMTLGVYLLTTATSVFLVFDPLGHRKPLVVHEVNFDDSFILDPKSDFRLRIEPQLRPDWTEARFPLYASRIYVVTNQSEKPITFQALLKVELTGAEHPLAAIGFGDRAGWSGGLKAIFDKAFGAEQNYLLSPVTLATGESVRGRFVFRVPASAEIQKETLPIWIAAFDPRARLDGTAYVDLRDIKTGDRLAEPLYLLSKSEPD